MYPPEGNSSWKAQVVSKRGSLDLINIGFWIVGLVILAGLLLLGSGVWAAAKHSCEGSNAVAFIANDGTCYIRSVSDGQAWLMRPRHYCLTLLEAGPQ